MNGTTKTKIDIFSGFLGAGKTTLIKKLIAEAYDKEKIVLIENEFGEIGVDSEFLKEAGIKTTEMNSGCICCSLVGDFSRALEKVIDEYAPERILIEPSGVGKLSDVIRAVESVDSDRLLLNSTVAVVDAKKCRMYMKNFGEFFNNQVEHAECIILSHTKGLPADKLSACVEAIRAKNEHAALVTTEWDELTGAQILEAMEKKANFTILKKKRITTSMSIITIMNTITSTVRTVSANATSIITIMSITTSIIMTTMPTKYSLAGAVRRHGYIPTPR